MIRILIAVLVIALCLTFQNVNAELIIFQHTGNLDPQTTGWNVVGLGGSVSDTPVTNDLGLGIDAWSVNDMSTGSTSIWQYEKYPNSTIVNSANTNGWSLKSRLRVVNVPDGVDSSVYFEYATATHRWYLVFGSQADGDPIVRLVTNQPASAPSSYEYILEGQGAGYHEFDLRFNPANQLSNLYVDGVERITGYPGFAESGYGPLVGWGGGQSGSTGHAHYAEVTFSVVPEPSTWIAAIACSFMLTHLLRKKRLVSTPVSIE
jgi:hypothetical protein